MSSVGTRDTLNSLNNAFVDNVRQAMLQRVDTEVTDRLRAAWKRGAHAAEAVQQENDQSFSSLMDSLADVHTAQHSLEAENKQLRHVITALAGRLSQMSTATAYSNPWGPLGAGWPSPAPPADERSPAPAASQQATHGANAASLPPFFAPNLTPPPAADCATGPPAGPGAMEELWLAATEDVSPPTPLMPPPAFRLQQQLSPQPPKPVPALGAKVSLADVLGINSPAPETPSTARSSSGSDTSGGTWTSSSEDVDAFVFGLTLRLADSTELGLTTSQSGRARDLRIEGVLPGGAAEAWNRQCGSSGAAEKVLLPGDKITSVNDVSGDPQAMLLACSSRRLLRLQIVRVGCSAPSSPRDSAPCRVDIPFPVTPTPASGGLAAECYSGQVNSPPEPVAAVTVGADGKPTWHL